MRFSSGAALVAATFLISGQAVALETRSYVVSAFWHAMDSSERDCPDGLNPKIKEQYEQNLAALGFSAREIASLFNEIIELFPLPGQSEIMRRGRHSGEVGDIGVKIIMNGG